MKMKTKCITITEEHANFVDSQRKTFNLSKFIQAKLDEYIKQINEIRQTAE